MQNIFTTLEIFSVYVPEQSDIPGDVDPMALVVKEQLHLLYN